MDKSMEKYLKWKVTDSIKLAGFVALVGGKETGGLHSKAPGYLEEKWAKINGATMVSEVAGVLDSKRQIEFFSWLETWEFYLQG